MLHNTRREAVSRQFRRHKSVRPLKRKRLTLIAAFRCGTPDDPSVVVCADSQETYGPYRVEVKKIQPRDAGQYDLIVGGSGNIGDLIDGLTGAIERSVSHWQAGVDQESGRQQLERILLAYHARQVALYPAGDDEKELKFIVCVRDKQSGTIHLWKTSGTSALSTEEYALIGWDEAIYKHQVKQFYRPNLSLAQTVLLGIDLISIGIKTSNYIGGPIQVIVARKEGVWADYPEDVKRLEERIERFNEELGRFALACLDVSMPDADFDKVLARFQKQIVLLRRTTAEEASVEHTKRQVRESRKSTEDDWQGFPYPKYSFEAVVDLLYGRERIQRAMQEARDAVKEEEAAEIQRNEARARLKRLPKFPPRPIKWTEVPGFGVVGVAESDAPVDQYDNESEDSEKDKG
jgi:20S proteasome alpha/beta subunit